MQTEDRSSVVVPNFFIRQSDFCRICKDAAHEAKPKANKCAFSNRSMVRVFLKVTVQFERCFWLMEHISVISCRNPINLYITEKLIKFSKSLFYFYLVVLNT